MRKSWLLILIAILVFILNYALGKPVKGQSVAAEPPAPQERKVDIPITGLQVMLRCDKVKASMADEVVFDVTILNVDEHPAYLFNQLDWGEGGGLLLWFHDGKMDRFRPWVDPPYPGPNPDGPGLFIKLDRGHFFGLREQWHAKNIGLGRPGKYTLWVEYQSPVFRENVYDPKFKRDQMPYWFNFKGVKSNEISFESTP